ncbi:MAG: hypothetical protein KAT41_04775 [Candidatus Marinimicrobia bacterium]|nr:hypothetical protein [Candidatus Neomarinimicrobiota bacterium]
MPPVNHNKIFESIKNQVRSIIYGAVITTFRINLTDLKNDVNVINIPDNQNVKVYEFGDRGILLFYLDNITDTEVWRESVRASVKLGVKKFLFIGHGKPVGESSNFVGSIISDHINVSGDNPLIGKNCEYFGVRFPDMSNLYDSELIKRIKNASLMTGIQCNKGILLIPLKVEQRTELEEEIIDKGNITAISNDVYAGAITAKHAGCKSAGVVLFRGDLNINIIDFVREILVS